MLAVCQNCAPCCRRCKMLLEDLMSQGTYVAVLPVLSTRALLDEWIDDMLIPNRVPPQDLHVTLLYSRQPVRITPTTNEFHADPVGFDIFQMDGKKVLVLLLESPGMSRRHQQFMALGATHDYSDYTPHVTLSYDIGENFDMSALELPHFHMIFGDEYSEELRD